MRNNFHLNDPDTTYYSPIKGWTNDTEDNQLEQIAKDTFGTTDPFLWSGSRAPRPDDEGPKLWSPESIEEFYKEETKPKCYYCKYTLNNKTITKPKDTLTEPDLTNEDLDDEDIQKVVIQFGYRKAAKITGLARYTIWNRLKRLAKQQQTQQIVTSPTVIKIQQIATKEWKNLRKLYNLPATTPISEYKPKEKQILYPQRKILAITNRATHLSDKLERELEQLGQSNYLDEDQILIKCKLNEVLKISVALIETFLEEPETTDRETRSKTQNTWNFNHSKSQIQIMNLAIHTAGIENNHSLVTTLLKLTKLPKGDTFVAKQNTDLSSHKTKEIGRLLGIRHTEITPIIQNAISKIRASYLALQDLHESAEQMGIKLSKPEPPQIKQKNTKEPNKWKTKFLWVKKPNRQTKNNTLDLLQIIKTYLNPDPRNLIAQIALRLLHEEPNIINQLATTINFATTPTDKTNLATLLDVSVQEIEEIKPISTLQQQAIYNACKISKNPLAKQLATQLTCHNCNLNKEKETKTTPKQPKTVSTPKQPHLPKQAPKTVSILKQVTTPKHVKTKTSHKIKPLVSDLPQTENTSTKIFYRCRGRKARRRKTPSSGNKDTHNNAILKNKENGQK